MSTEVKSWNTIIEQYKSSGLSQVAFCKAQALSRHQFQYRWYLYNRAQKSSNLTELLIYLVVAFWHGNLLGLHFEIINLT